MWAVPCIFCWSEFNEIRPGRSWMQMRGVMWLQFSHESQLNTDYHYTTVLEPIRSVCDREAL
jgi:hypothetical protein